MFDRTHMPECPPVTCRLTRFFDAPPEQIVQAWRDPNLFLRLRADQPDAFVQFDISPCAEHRFAITFGRSGGLTQERLPLRVTCESIQGEVEECDGLAPDCEDTVSLTLAVTSIRPKSEHRRNGTPCTLSISLPRPEWTGDIAVALKSVAETLDEHLQRQRRGH